MREKDLKKILDREISNDLININFNSNKTFDKISNKLGPSRTAMITCCPPSLPRATVRASDVPFLTRASFKRSV